MFASNYKFDTLSIVAKLDTPEDARLCRIIRKKSGGNTLPSVGGYVPKLTQDLLLDIINHKAGLEYLIESVQSVQDRIARRLLDDVGNGNVLEFRHIGIDEIIAQLMLESEVAARLSKESIELWFNSDLYPLLLHVLNAKGLTDIKVKAHTTAFRGYFVTLAGKDKNVLMAKAVKGQLEKALELLPPDYEHELYEKLITKLRDTVDYDDALDAL